MYSIEGNDIGTVWTESIKTILRYGVTVTDDKGLIRELSPLYLHIHHPAEHDPIIERYGDKEMLLFMQQNFENANPITGWGYSYAERLYGKNNTNQIAQIISKLIQYPATKSATLSLLRPEDDKLHTPCLTTLDFKIRQHILCVHAFFRSQDIGKKLYADALQLLRLGKSMANDLLIENISLFLSICSAHIYEDDIPEMKRIIKELD